MLLEMIMQPAYMDGSFWGPPRMVAALVMSKDVLSPPADFNLTIDLVGMLIHFALSIIYAFIIGLIVSRTPMSIAICVGLIAGLLLYYINFYVLTNLFRWLWFRMSLNWVSLFAHVVFGVAVAWMFKLFFKNYVEPQHA